MRSRRFRVYGVYGFRGLGLRVGRLRAQGLGWRLSCSKTPWCLVGNGGMDIGDYYWGLYRDYYRDSFPHSLLSTRPKRNPDEHPFW